MLARLSLRNAKRQFTDYLVYGVTVLIASALIFSFNALAASNEITTLSEQLENLPLIVALATTVVTVIIGWLISYTQNFILRKRGREFGTYILMGLTSKQVARLFALENIISGLCSMLAGIVVGNLLFQALRAVFLNFFGLEYTFAFTLSPKALLLTVICFALVFFISSVLSGRRIRSSTVSDLMNLDRKNEQVVIEEERSRRRAYKISLVCGFFGVLLLLSFNVGLSILGSILLLIFCYSFFFGFSSGIPHYFDRHPKKKYRSPTLLVFRSLSSKLGSMGIVLGTVSLLLTSALLTEGSALLFQNQFEQNRTLTTAFDLFIVQESNRTNMTKYESYISKKLNVVSQHEYSLFSSGKDQLTTQVKQGREQKGYYDDDQVMLYSDYAALRNMLGYPEVDLNANEYIIHCLEHLQPIFENYPDDYDINGLSLKRAGVYTEVFNQYLWEGNGNGFVVVVPDNYASSLSSSMVFLAAMTEKPVTGEAYEGLLNIREKRSALNEGMDGIKSKAAVNEEYASLSALIIFPLFYLALILIMSALTVLTVQFLSDTNKLRLQYCIMSKLGMARHEMKLAVNQYLLFYYGMPVLPALTICVIFMVALSRALDSRAIMDAAQLCALIGVALTLFFVVYLLYVIAAGYTIRKKVLHNT